jgi:peptidoglycan/LPS O-acetylase OafA/YrhL
MGQLTMPPRDGRLAGLDLVRVFALGLVTAQHALTLTGHDEWAGFAGLSVGQVGVALFLGVSVLLAAESRRPPLPWLAQRLRRVFPAYWLAIGASFFLTWLTGHKRFGAAQVVAQLLGVGLFTHGDNLVNTPTWFVSLLLVCYLGTFAARLVRAPVVAGVCASIALAILVGVERHPWLLSHLLTYSLASTLASVPRGYRTRIVLPVAGRLLALALWRQAAFGYTALALIAVELALCLRWAPRLIGMAAEYSYEYYLVHGLALYGVIRSLPSRPLAAVCCAIVLAAATAVALHWFVDRMDQALSRGKAARPGPALRPAVSDAGCSEGAAAGPAG